MKAGFIGLGAMGAPMAAHLQRHALLAVVGSRGQEKAARIAGELGVRAGVAARDFAECDVVALCVPADIDVLAQVDRLAEALRPGAVVVDHSTVSVATARTAAVRLAARGIGFVDAPVSGGVEGARNGNLSVMAGADVVDLDKVKPVLACYAARVTHMGAAGAGQATKAVNQVLVAGINEAVCTGLALGEHLGLDAQRLLPTLMAGAAANWFLDKRGLTMLRNEFVPGFKCAHMYKDLRIVREMAVAAGIDTQLIDLALADYRALSEAGLGEADTSALIERKRRRDRTDRSA